MTKYETCKQVMEEYFALFPANSERLYARLDMQIWKNTRKSKPKVEQEDKRKFLDFVYLTPDEYNKLCVEFWEMNTKKCVLALNNYIWSKGTQYKSHFYTIKARAKKDNLSPPKPKVEAQIEIINEMSEEQKKEIKDRLINLRRGFAMPV